MNRDEATKRAKELVGKMTVDEAASQLRFDSPAIERLGIPEYNWWNEALHGVARAGTATVFPQAIGLAATFDEELLEEVGHAIGLEGRAKYNEAQKHGDRDIYKGLTFWAPNVNIFRDPRWGRGHETYGEDPYLTGRMGTAFIKGMQTKTEDGYLLTAACAKHFAVHSGPEDLRHTFDAQVSDKELFETYLPAFEMCVKEGKVEAVMGAYNRVNGKPCCGHDYLIKDVLRGQWGFEGHFVSDCWAVQDFHMHHHVTERPEESVKLALESGCDVNCGCTYQRVMNAYEEGILSEETIREAAVRLMTTRYMLGMFDKTELDDIPYEVVDCPEHQQLNDRAAAESLVLLKNDGILPITVSNSVQDAGLVSGHSSEIQRLHIKTLGVIGPNADSRRALMGNYYGTASRYITVLEGIQDEAREAGNTCGVGDIRVMYAEGCHLYKDKPDSLAKEDNRLAEALTVTQHSDVVILCLGLDESLEGEEGDEGNAYASGDKKDLHLPACQEKLLKSIVETGKPVVLCNLAGSAIDLSYAQNHVNAIIQAWYPGARGGRAIARLLFGKEVPMGKLAVTFYKDTNDLPAFTDYSMKNRTYRFIEDEPLYPFGYGLGYGKAEITELKLVDDDKFSYARACERDVELIVRIKNDFAWKVCEVLQVYVKVLGTENEVLNPKLAAFKRVNIESGEEISVNITVPKYAFSTVDERGIRVFDGCDADICVGFSSKNTIKINT